MSYALIFVWLGLGLFWVSMLGLLWRRNLVGMLLGVLIGWLSVISGSIGAALRNGEVVEPVGAAGLILVLGLVCGLQVALGLSLIIARITRRGSLDVQEAELLEG
jgi:NADH:ubiquinone oxidoreductase subunit K